MLASVRAQIMACHAADRAAGELAAFASGPGSRRADIGWIDSVREGALGYLAVYLHHDAEEAAQHFGRAADRSNDWLRAAGLPFGSTPHRALAACALHRSGGTTEACLALAHEALHDAREHAVVVDEVAARRAAEALYRHAGDRLRAEHHALRAQAAVRRHGLQTWDRMLRGELTRVRADRRTGASMGPTPSSA
ncbi:MAG: hypothetical protein U5K81_02245 [Trueperaceae bacterium]|nr:hypothetical protein [Trueperaceae bacterium]